MKEKNEDAEVDILCEIHKSVDLRLKADVALGSPHEPELEDVIVASTLDRLVTSVVRHVVMLVTLEEIVCF